MSLVDYMDILYDCTVYYICTGKLQLVKKFDE